MNEIYSNKRINKQVLKSREKSVDDEFIGLLTYNQINDSWNFTIREDYSTTFYNAKDIDKKNIITIILESPHKEEFGLSLTDNKTKESIFSRPLNNKKSRKGLIFILENVFQKYFKNILDKNFDYKILLINSIKFQTSLGLTDKGLRNEIWILNWIKLKTDFIRRIKSYTPDIIINLCTKGHYKVKNEWFSIDKLFLKNIGFSLSKWEETDDCLFTVRHGFNEYQFTLQDAVERELEINNIINNKNYRKYDHPSSISENHVIKLSKNKMSKNKIIKLTYNNEE